MIRALGLRFVVHSHRPKSLKTTVFHSFRTKVTDNNSDGGHYYYSPKADLDTPMQKISDYVFENKTSRISEVTHHQEWQMSNMFNFNIV
jgi:hypothetical protein